jgi:hypothetical protein
MSLYLLNLYTISGISYIIHIFSDWLKKVLFRNYTFPSPPRLLYLSLLK